MGFDPLPHEEEAECLCNDGGILDWVLGPLLFLLCPGMAGVLSFLMGRSRAVVLLTFEMSDGTMAGVALGC